MGDLLNLDYELFRLINSAWSNSFLDWLMPIWRSKLFWIPLYAFIFSFLLINFGKNGFIVILFSVITITMSDTLSSKVIKKSIERVRPCNSSNLKIIADLELRVKCGGGYSFTSSHATNHFALAIFLMLVFGKKYKWVRSVLIFWAASIAYGQVYVGVHFPSDVFAGAIVGSIVGWICFYFYKRFSNKYKLSI